MYLNKVLLYGNLTRDPELKALPSGGQVANFGMATNRVFKDKNGQKQEVTEFHNVVAFGRTAEVIAQYVKKGRPIYVEGRLQTRTWDDKESGKKVYRTEIVVGDINLLSGPDGARADNSRIANSSADASQKDESAADFDGLGIQDSEIPF